MSPIGGRRHGARQLRLAPALVLAALAALALLFAAPGGAEANAGKQRLLQVLKPHDDVLMRGRQLRVRVRLAKGASLRDATLGGRDVKRLFHRAGSSRVLVATLDKRRLGRALPKGRNFLHVVVRRGGRLDAETISFTRVVPSKRLVTRFRAGFRPRFGLRAIVEPRRPTARVRVTLNGRNVSRLFRKGTPLRRSVRLGASDGLRHGVNHLRVLVFDYHGEYRLLRRKIRAGRRTTIAGAGPDRRLRAGGTIRLDGRGTERALRRDGRARPGKLRFRWTLRHKPRGSRARLSRRSRARPVLSTDLPGSYRLELRSSQAGAGTARSTSLDSIEVTAEPQPLVPVSTMAEVGGLQGIQVGVSRECSAAKAAAAPPCFYPNPGKASDLQVVVLDRETLEPVSNKAYSTDDLGEFAAAMAKFATKLEPTQNQKCLYAYETGKLVLLALREGTVADQTDLEAGLRYFSASREDCSPSGPEPDFVEGPDSMIAVPGTLAGRAASNNGIAVVGPQGTGRAGSLDGYLKIAADNPTEVASTRSFEFGEEIPFDTRAEDGKAVRVGAASLPIPASPTGLLVYDFDAANPSQRFELVKTITNVGGSTEAGLEWSALAEALQEYGQPGNGLMIVSNGKIGGFATEPDSSSFVDVLSELERLGANPDTFARAVNQDGTYSLIVADGYNADPIAYASSSVMADGVPDTPKVTAAELPVNQGRLTGMLHRGPDSYLFPVEVDPSGQSQQPELRALLFSEQVEWQLTPAPEAGSATCQQTALAYVVEQAGGLFPEGAAPKLWEDARARGCQGIPHAATGAGRRADSLEGDGCASQEATAIGAIGANVREAAMALRGAYPSLTYELSEAEVLGVSLPAGAPFTAADLACAKNQVVDELAARKQSERLFEVLRKPQNELQGRTVIDFGRIAEEIKTAALASITKQLSAQPSSTASFWASFGLQILSEIAKLGTVVAPEAAPAWMAGARLIELSSSAAQTGITGGNGPPGDPAATADEYILLASQIEQKEVDIEAQIEEVLTAQDDSAAQALELVVSDPHKMAVVNEKAKGAWSVSPEALELAQKAYEYRVTQMAYEALLPQVFYGVRFNYTNAVQISHNCLAFYWHNYAWHEVPIHGRVQVLSGCDLRSLAGASEADYEYPLYEFRQIAPGADLGSPAGLGQSNEYQAQVGVATAGATPTSLDYLMVDPSSLSGKRVPSLAAAANVAPAFEVGEQANGSPVQFAGGLFAPDFWFRNLGLRRTMHTNFYPPNGEIPDNWMWVGPTERLAFGDGDTWPTPP